LREEAGGIDGRGTGGIDGSGSRSGKGLNRSVVVGDDKVVAADRLRHTANNASVERGDWVLQGSAQGAVLGVHFPGNDGVGAGVGIARVQEVTWRLHAGG